MDQGAEDTAATVQSLSEEIYRATRTDPGQSLSLARQAVRLAQRNHSPFDLGLATRGLGHAWRAAAHYRRAMSAYAASDRAFERAGEPIEKARNAIGKLDALMYLGQYERALREADEAQAVFQRAGETRRLATIRVNLGSLYFRLDRYAEAAEAYQRSLEFFEADEDEETVANVRCNLASVQSCLLQFDQAARLYQSGLEYFQKVGMRVLEATTEYNVACLDSIRGYYSEALQKLEHAITVLEQAGDQGLVASCQLEQAEIFLSLSMPERAERAAREAASRFFALGMRYENAKCLSNEGVALALGGNLVEAREPLGQALGLFRQEGNTHWMGISRIHLAEIHRRRGRKPEAEALAKAALQSLSGQKEARAVALAELVLGSFGGRTARMHLGRAIRSLHRAQVPGLESEALATLARELHREGRYRGARLCLGRAIQLAETLRARMTSGSLRRQFHSSKADLYARMALLELEDPRRALDWLEQGRARALVEILEDRDFRGEGIDRPARRKGNEERWRELNLLYRMLDAQTWTGERAAEEQTLRKRMECLEQELGDEELYWASSARRQGPSSVEGGSDPDLLHFEGLAIEYFEVDGVFGCAAVLNGDIRMLPAICRVEEVASLLRQFRLALSRALVARPGESQRHGEAELRQLYRRLLEPVEHHFPLQEHLLILPSGLLSYVPFAALLDSAGVPLAGRTTLSHSPSLAVQNRWAKGDREVRAASSEASLVFGYGPNLPAVQREVEEVAGHLPQPVVLLSGADATLGAFRRHAQDARLLHIASHGIFRRDHPLFSSLILADGRLSFYDLFRLRLQADLVVLSACETGQSDGQPGEELVGLAGGFLMAGARSVLVSLWEVLDESSARFMERMYRHLAQGDTIAEALAATMMEIRRITPDPIHWAPYVLLGDPTTRLFEGRAPKHSLRLAGSDMFERALGREEGDAGCRQVR